MGITGFVVSSWVVFVAEDVRWPADQTRGHEVRVVLCVPHEARGMRRPMVIPLPSEGLIGRGPYPQIPTRPHARGRGVVAALAAWHARVNLGVIANDTLAVRGALVPPGPVPPEEPPACCVLPIDSFADGVITAGARVVTEAAMSRRRRRCSLRVWHRCGFRVESRRTFRLGARRSRRGCREGAFRVGLFSD